MKIAVCVKQVPNTTEIKIDPVKNTLIRKGVPSIMNPYDLHALELALSCKDRYGAQVSVLSMGPTAAKDVLREAIARGADQAYLITDRKFGGSDTYATSNIIAAALRYLGGFDLVIGGKQAIDGDTGQTIPSVAEHLGLPRVGQVLSFERCTDESSVESLVVSNVDEDLAVDAFSLIDNANEVTLTRITDEGIETCAAQLPLVITVVKETNKPRYASIGSTLAALSAPIFELSYDNLAPYLDDSKIGLKGSPTRVKKTFVPNRCAQGMWFKGDSDGMARELVCQLKQARVLV